MQVTVLAPSARLAPYVERFTVVESRESVTRALLPEPGVILGVRYAGAASLVVGDAERRVSDVAITGVQGEARTMHTHAGSGIVLAMFRPAAAAPLVRAPLHELFGHTLALDEVLPRTTVQQLGDRIAAAPDMARRIAVLEEFLLARLDAPPDPLVIAAVRAIEGARGTIRIAELARALAISQDPLEKRFRRAVGATPKQLASLVRVRHAIELGRRAASWSRVALEAGYFDQSHFIRAFRAVTGQAPEQFFARTPYC